MNVNGVYRYIKQFGKLGLPTWQDGGGTHLGCELQIWASNISKCTTPWRYLFRKFCWDSMGFSPCMAGSRTASRNSTWDLFAAGKWEFWQGTILEGMKWKVLIFAAKKSDLARMLLLFSNKKWGFDQHSTLMHQRYIRMSCRFHRPK